jgi:hypothetical protein
MVVVAVGDEHVVGFGHVRDIEGERGEVLDGPEQAVQNGVDQERGITVLDQDRCMRDEGHAQARVRLYRLPVDVHRAYALVPVEVPELVSAEELPLEDVQKPAVFSVIPGVGEAVFTVMELSAGDLAQGHAVAVLPVFVLLVVLNRRRQAISEENRSQDEHDPENIRYESSHLTNNKRSAAGFQVRRSKRKEAVIRHPDLANA